MTPDPRALAAWTFRNRLAAAHVAALPISHRGSAATPCVRCLAPTKQTKGVCVSCAAKEKK